MNFIWDNFFKKEKHEEDIVTLLSSNFLFSSLNASELKFVSGLVHQRDYRPGEIIFQQGDIGVGLYLIVKGNVNITVEDLDKSGTPKAHFLTRLNSGDFFGELALVEKHERRTATATAADDVTLLGFFKPDMSEIVERNPRTGIKIMSRLAEILARRLKETASKFNELKDELQQLSPPAGPR